MMVCFWGDAKLFSVGAVEGGVVIEACLGAGNGRGVTGSEHSLGKQQPFVGKIFPNGAAGEATACPAGHRFAERASYVKHDLSG